MTPGGAPGGGGHVGLAADPGEQCLRGRLVAVAGRLPVGAQRRGERGRGPRDGRQPAFEQLIDGLGQGLRVVLGDHALGEHVLFEGVEPGVDDLAERARRVGGGRQLLDETAVDGLQLVQRCLGLGDLHLGGGHAAPLGPLGEPAGEERLARAVLAAHRLEGGPAGRDAVQFFVDGALEPLHADREQVKARAAARCHGAARR